VSTQPNSRPNSRQPSFRRYDPFAGRPLKSVPPVGPIPARVYLIGERPGENEARRGLPFIGPAGKYLDICLAAANIERSQCRINNLVSTFAGYGKPTKAEIDRDHDALVADILECDPEVIGLVGGWSVEHVLGVEHAEMEKVHGVPQRVPALFGGELPRDGGWTVLPLLHPAGATHSPDSLPLILDDILQLGRLLDHEIAVRESDPFAGREDYRDYPVSGRGVIVHKPAGVDTEGSRVHPWCMTVSTRPGTGMLFKPGQRVTFKGKVYLWNALHDLGVLKNLGIELADDQYVDLMILAYNLCVHPQGLKPSAYRNCGMHQDDYDDIVREARLTKAMDYLLAAADRDWPKAEPQVIEDAGKYRVYKPKSVNFRIKKILDDWTKWQVGGREEEVDLRKRWRDIDDVIKAPVIEAMGELPDATLDDVPYERAKFYAIRDADATLRMAPILEQKIKDMGLEEIAAIDHAILPMLDSAQQNGIRLDGPEFWNGIESQCESQMSQAQYQVFKLTGEDINPGSGDQVAALLYGKLGLTPPKYTDSGERGSVNAVCLEALLGQNPVIQHIMDYTEASKIRGTYVLPLRKLCMLGDRRVRSTIRSTRTTTGRLAMADPPLHQIPIMTDLGKQLRGGFIAESGHVLYDIDVNQLEMRIMAHDSRDEELCRLFFENRDIHAETACSIFSVPMNALNVGPTGKVNDYRRTVAKHCIAENELVLTDQGLIPIQNITVQHKLWDGVEWVTHGGLIDQGIREVITYEGLTATPDHEVVTETGTIRTFGEVASSLDRLHTTGDEREALRTRYRSLLESSAQERIHRAESEMHEVWPDLVDHQVEPSQARVSRLQKVQYDEIQTSMGFRQKIRCHIPTLQHPSLSRLQELWGSRHQVPVQITRGVCEVGGEEFAASRLQGHNDRPDQQRWSLQARQSSTRNDSRAESKQAYNFVDDIPWRAHSVPRLRQSVRGVVDISTSASRNDRRANHHRCDSSYQKRASIENVAEVGRMAQFARVYDIVNAGPRRCFTASGKLVLNCAFGIINGITEHGLVNYMILNRCRRPDGEPWNIDDCLQMREAWFQKYSGVRRFQNECIDETRQTGLARETIGGRIIYLPQVWSPDKRVRESAERMSYVMHTQAGGQTLIKKCMAMVWREVCKVHREVKFLLQMHDELLFELPDDENLKREVDQRCVDILCNEVKLRVPVLADGGFGNSWLHAH